MEYIQTQRCEIKLQVNTFEKKTKPQTETKQSDKPQTQPTLTELDADDKYSVKANNVK